MIHTSRQLKDLIKNKSKGNSAKAQILLRNYMMERFLERMSLSKYKKNFILKGGMLVSSMVGIDFRSTMDIDTTLKNIPLSVESATEIIEDIISVHLDDEVSFKIKTVSEIMEESEYGGIRVSLDAVLDMMRIPLKIDISTGDVVTPREIEYGIKLMFEEREIDVYAYNLETVLAEKLETIITRGTANTRLRDFYDLHILTSSYKNEINYSYFKMALTATCEKRNSIKIINDAELILEEIYTDENMRSLWKAYQDKFDYARIVSWDMVIVSAKELVCKYI